MDAARERSCGEWKGPAALPLPQRRHARYGACCVLDGDVSDAVDAVADQRGAGEGRSCSAPELNQSGRGRSRGWARPSGSWRRVSRPSARRNGRSARPSRWLGRGRGRAIEWRVERRGTRATRQDEKRAVATAISREESTLHACSLDYIVVTCCQKK